MQVDHEEIDDIPGDVERIEISHRDGTIVVAEDPEQVSVAVVNDDDQSIMLDAGELTVWHEGETEDFHDRLDDE